MREKAYLRQPLAEFQQVLKLALSIASGSAQ
jgi:hypothetical protein